METSFEYNKQTVVMGSLNIKDISKFAIECSNDEGQFWYMIVSTMAGESSIITFGPVVIDTDYFFDYYKSSLQKIDYKEPKLYKIVDNFINDTSKAITKIEELPIDEAVSQYKDITTILDL